MSGESLCGILNCFSFLYERTCKAEKNLTGYEIVSGVDQYGKP